MANLDNGLPPKDTDIKGNTVNAALVTVNELIKSRNERVTEVLLTNRELIEAETGRVTDVLISKEENADSNWFSFL